MRHVQVPTILSLLTEEYRKRAVQEAYHHGHTNKPMWPSQFCWPEGFLRRWHEWDFALGGNSRLVASYEQAELRLAEAWARPGSADGDEELIPGVEVRHTGGHSGGHQAIIVRGRDETVAFIGDLCMRPWSANPRWITSFDDFPLTSVEVKAALFAEAAEEGWTIVLSHEPRRPVGKLVPSRDKFRFEPTI
jgi:glyoxylase-like metal-dependent hydrolase (beta-lactamase superfamily II)